MREPVALAVLLSIGCAGSRPSEYPQPAAGADAHREPPGGREWVPRESSFGWLRAFRVRTDVRAANEQTGAMLRGRLRDQVERTLRNCETDLVDAPNSRHPPVDGVGEIAVEVSLIDSQAGTAISWTLQVLQTVQLENGSRTVASTWRASDLALPPTYSTFVTLRDSLQNGLNDFCRLYKAARSPQGGTGR